MWGWNCQVWEKSKRITQYDKRIIICDVGTAQCKDRTVKCEKKKSKENTKYEKKTITCDVGTTQYKDETVKCEKKVKEPLNVRKKLSHVMLELYNVRMKPSNVRKK